MDDYILEMTGEELSDALNRANRSISYEEQDLTLEQQAQARRNIGVGSSEGGSGGVEYHDFVIDDIEAYKAAAGVTDLLTSEETGDIGYNQIVQSLKLPLFLYKNDEHIPIFENCPFIFEDVEYPFLQSKQIIHDIIFSLTLEGEEGEDPLEVNYPIKYIMYSDGFRPRIEFETANDTDIDLIAEGRLNAEHLSQVVKDEILGLAPMFNDAVSRIRIVYSMHETGDDIVGEIKEVE